MTNQEIFNRYRNEVRNAQYSEIHKNYREEANRLSSSNGAGTFMTLSMISIPLEILSLILAIVLFVKDVPSGGGVFAVLFIVFIITRKVFNGICERIEDKNNRNYQLFRPLSDRYYQQYQSVVGYYNDIYFGRVNCYDRDAQSGYDYCPLTGKVVYSKNCSRLCQYRQQYQDNLFNN